MTNITRIDGGSIDEKGADPVLVKLLEDCTEMARRGEFVTVAVIATMPNGKSFDAWHIMQNGTLMLGAVYQAAHAIAESAHTSQYVGPEE